MATAWELGQALIDAGLEGDVPRCRAMSGFASEVGHSSRDGPES